MIFPAKGILQRNLQIVLKKIFSGKSRSKSSFYNSNSLQIYELA